MALPPLRFGIELAHPLEIGAACLHRDLYRFFDVDPESARSQVLCLDFSLDLFREGVLVNHTILDGCIISGGSREVY